MDGNDDYYKHLRQRIVRWLESEEGRKFKWAEHLLVAPDLFHLLCKLALDADVPVAEKAKLAGVLAYWISPIDVVPEAILGVVGYVDDVVLAAYVLNSIINKTSAEVVRRHWAGNGDVLDVIQRVLKAADDMVGSRLWTKLKGLVG